ncbi:MAG: glycosyltransferase [Bacillota bacterium]
MIVKNEAASLARCLYSVKDGVDEMVVVDTGSTDGTPDIAVSLGAKVFAYEWNDDFAAARNFSLEQASGDWLLYLDADEELEHGDAERLRHLAQVSQAEAFTFQINNLTDGNDLTRHINVRMFRNRPDYRFEGRLHEQIAGAILEHNPGQAVIHSSGLTLLHYGYLSSVFAAKNKGERNLHLNLKMVEEEPDNPFYLYTLGNSYMSNRQFAKALDCYEHSLHHLNPDAIYAPSVFVSSVSCLLRLGHWRRALTLLERGKSLYPDYADIRFLEGEIFQQLGHLHRAQACFEHCLTIGERLQSYTTRTGVGSFLALFALAEMARNKQDFSKALTLQKQALQQSPPNFERCMEMVSLMRLAGQSNEQVLRELREIICEQGPPTRDLAMAQVLHGAKEYELALTVLDHQNEAGSGLKGMALMGLGRFDEARGYLAVALKRTLGDPAVAEELILCHWLSSQRQSAAAVIEQLPDLTARETYRQIDSCLTGYPTMNCELDQDTLIKVIDRLLGMRQPILAMEVLVGAASFDAARQIALLLRAPLSVERLELAAKLALKEIKTQCPDPAFYLVLAEYLLRNHELVLAEKMISHALAATPNDPAYRRTMSQIHRRMLQDVLQEACNHYPGNGQFLEQLLDLQEGVPLAAVLKGVH